MDVWQSCKPFVTGSLAGCVAFTIIQPVDMVKVRIQLGAAEGGSTSPLHIAKTMLANEGVTAFYRGIGAGYLRQVLYTGSRLSLYDAFTGAVSSPGEKMPFWKSSVCALSAGGIAAVIGNPADLTLIRMQADSMLPEAERRGYRNVFHALGMVVKEDGAMGLFKGAGPTATRAMALNFGMLSFNTQAKQQLESMGHAPNSNVTVFGGAFVGGFAGAFFSLPFDFIKTQIQKQKPDANGNLLYKGPVDCARQIVAAGGVTRLWSGFPVYFLRSAPLSTITLIAQDYVRRLWKEIGL
mmetsp:Transcript_24004/g.61070  ORF Transcript_24004/g.61070 Transcript_24004/m.61070 type:complete len:295 (-) Transcript_24004:197-1081(-)